MYALFEDIRLDYKLSAAEQAGSFSIATAQIDNQLLTSTHPVVLSHDAAPPQATPHPTPTTLLQTYVQTIRFM